MEKTRLYTIKHFRNLLTEQTVACMSVVVFIWHRQIVSYQFFAKRPLKIIDFDFVSTM